jgi:hypothetical protein
MLPQIQKVQQLSESYCGPAVLQMLLSAVGEEVTQEKIVDVLGLADRIEEHGVRPDQLGLACVLLAPDHKFWYKYQATLDDVKTVLDTGFAVGVEWQSLFYDSEEEESEDYDYEEPDSGHYSIISFFDEQEDQLIMVDPYRYFARQDRIFDTEMFLRRWWDTNEVRDQRTGKSHIVTDERLLFFVTPNEVFFPREYGFKVFQGQRDS